jgi:hypothetical protein
MDLFVPCIVLMLGVKELNVILAAGTPCGFRFCFFWRQEFDQLC